MEYVLFGSIGILALLPIVLFNKLISSRQNVKEAWAGVDVQLTRRHDLIPNLVEVVKGYAKHEDKLFTSIAMGRSKALSLSGKNSKELEMVEENLTRSVKSILAISESYPELKADEQFLKLQSQLSETEDQIASARRIYNSNVADYNTIVSVFPTNIIAKIFGFSPLPFFEGNK